MASRRLAATSLLFSALGVLPLTVGDAGAACTDLASVDAVRAQVELQCDCASAVTHKVYVKCAKIVARSAVAEGRLPRQCLGAVKRCAAKSTCGEPGAVTCLRTSPRGVKCSIKRDASRCTASASSCVGASPFCCDADAGCATPLPACGNGTVDAGETCDPPGSITCPAGSAAGAFLACNADCSCPTSASTTTLQPPATTSTTTTSTTTTTRPTQPLVCADPILGLPPIVQVPVTITVGTSNCGGAALSPPASSPFSGQLDGPNGKLADLGTGCLHFGSGQSTLIPGGRLPDGAKLSMGVVGLRGLGIVLGPGSGSGPKDCTRPAGPGRHCVNGSPGSDGQGACTVDADCDAGAAGSCALDANCFFGPPLPLPVATAPTLSVCVVNAFEQGACGQMDLLAGTATFSAGVSARAYLTGNVNAPCPRCVGGRCDGGRNSGGQCQAVGSAGTSIDCPPSDTLFSGVLPVVLQGGSTERLELAASNGMLCSGQQAPGAFGRPDAIRIVTRGSRLQLLNLLSRERLLTLAAPFCIASTGNGLIDGVAGLPGPGVFSVPARVDLGDLLGLGLLGS